MTRLAFILYGSFVAALLVLGWFGDRALTHQSRAAESEAISQLDEAARTTARAVRATLAQIEQTFLTGQPWPEMATGRLAQRTPPRFPPNSFVPYLQRDLSDLSRLISSAALTPSGLPESVVAAMASGSPATKAQVADRMLRGELPLRPEDIDYIASLLEIEDDSRCHLLREMLSRAPPATSLPDAPDFQRGVRATKVVEGWTRNGAERWVYEIPVSQLLRSAGVADHASLPGDPFSAQEYPSSRTIAVSDVDQLTLVVTPEIPGRIRIRILRILVWIAVLASAVGATFVLRAFRTQTRALAHEKAFLANVTHELRTPLASIRLFGETLSDGRGDPEEYGSLVAQESERLESLVERVLAATKISEHASFVRLNAVDLVESTVGLILERARRKSIQVSIRNSPVERSLSVFWDAEGVRQALLNLLDNAVKYGHSGGRVDVGVTREGSRVRLSVEDNGPGIRRGNRKKLFGRFQRGDSEEAGAGLGLYVVDQVAQAHGGTVDLETEEGRGSIFTLILPIEPPRMRREPT